MIDFLWIVVGFVVLILGANYLVEGASGLAKRFNVPDLVIGLTIVSFGTSAPELIVNIIAASNPNSTDLALTNIIGSNMINTFVILGLAAVIYPIASQKSSRRFDMPFNLLAPVLIAALLWWMGGSLHVWGGIILLLFFAWFMAVVVRKSIQHPEELLEEEIKPIKVWLAILMIVGGLAGLVGGANLIVPSATNIAQAWGISQAVIGLTIVALGTSLPELATSAVAAYKKNSDIALGNVLGSNVFNVFFVLGVSSILNPLPAYANVYIDLAMVALAMAIVLVAVYTSKNHKINRLAGFALLFIYIAFLSWVITTQ